MALLWIIENAKNPWGQIGGPEPPDPPPVSATGNVSSMAWNRCVLATTLFVIYLAAMLENMPVEPLIERRIIVLKYSKTSRKRPPKMSSLGGRLREVVAKERWSLTRGSFCSYLTGWRNFGKVVAYERWSLTGGGRTGRFNFYKSQGKCRISPRKIEKDENVPPFFARDKK